MPVKGIPSGFDKNVFINCPFDDKYLPLFRAVVFTVHEIGFRARCALEACNAGNIRIDKIQNIIAECKVILVMDIEPYRYRKFISDISGQDVYAHGGTQKQIINEVREWLRPELDPTKVIIPSGTEIMTRFRQFKRVLPSICLKFHWDPIRLGFVDYAFAVASWSSANPL